VISWLRSVNGQTCGGAKPEELDGRGCACARHDRAKL